MEDAVSIEDNKITKMGASSNNNAARVAVLQERRKQIEETLAKRNQELRQLCIQEAELTGITPPEMPLEPGETLPSIRRRVGTTYQLPENLVKNSNNKDEIIADLELQIQLHANMAEAALGLANEQNMSKTMKRQHRAEYQKHKNKCIALQEKLALLKEKAAIEQHKQKKKPRAPDFMDDNISLSTNMNEPFIKSDIRHSIRSAKHSLPSSSDSSSIEQRYHQELARNPYRNSDMPYTSNHSYKQDDFLTSGVYRLSLNGYSKYMERRENINNMYPSSNYSMPSQNFYQYNPHIQQGQQHSPHFQQNSPQLFQHSPHSSQHSPLLSHVSQHSPLLSQHSPQSAQCSPQLSHHFQYSSQTIYYPQYSQDFNKLNISPHFSSTQLHRQSSPTSVPSKSQYYSSYTIHGQPPYRHFQGEGTYRNPHQIQPHQQYEQMNVLTSGLGGCWKKSENGELVWCNANTIDVSWQRDKRFGSLDRRKNKRIPKRVSPNIDHKSATLATVPNYQDQIRSASVKSSQIISRRSQDNGQLVRTQSLGSVGAQTVDSVYPSDDNSSCGSDNRISQSLRKQKEKEWLETSLDGPVSPTNSLRSSSQPTIPTVLAPEEKYVNSPAQQILRPITPKPLEIPAESNPTPRVPETNIELFNNNIPKNCTVVQAGHCKPYHEETKPFEMSDFYKYSTKFKKSPVKAEANQNSIRANSVRSLNECFEDPGRGQYSPKMQPFNNSTNTVGSLDNSATLNSSLELTHIKVSEHFSEEMNAWYKDQQQTNNNTETASKSRSTATLV